MSEVSRYNISRRPRPQASCITATPTGIQEAAARSCMTDTGIQLHPISLTDHVLQQSVILLTLVSQSTSWST
ncbi:unnamed protein product [Lota lota]